MGRAFEYRKAAKFARWARMAKDFTRVGREIAIAVKAGGPNPETNPALRRAIQNAKGVNMPKENIERAIKKASGADADNYEEITFEGYGPYGVPIFIECTTNNNIRTVANVRAIFNKFNGSLGKNGELAFIFERKGIFTIETSAIKMPWEDFELEIIDAGAEDIDKDDDTVIITTAFEDFGPVSNRLEELGVEVKNAQLQRIPNITKQLPLEQAKEILKMIQKFEEDDDVQHVYHNLELTDELLEND